MRAVYCPECHMEIEITREYYGKHVQCPRCSETFEVPFPKALLELPKPELGDKNKPQQIEFPKTIAIDGVRISIGDAFMLMINFLIAYIAPIAAAIVIACVIFKR